MILHSSTRVCVCRCPTECATVGEYRDLLSEFNLLKHASHRNVIKLIGICSRDGTNIISPSVFSYNMSAHDTTLTAYLSAVAR